MNCLCGPRRPPLFSLSWICLISQTKWRILTVTYKQWISERLKGELHQETTVRGGLILKPLCVCLFYSQFWPGLFLAEHCILLPSGCCWDCLWSSRGVFPLPCLPPKMPSYSTDKHTIWIFPSNSFKTKPSAPCGTHNSSSLCLMDSFLHHLERVLYIGHENEGT